MRLYAQDLCTGLGAVPGVSATLTQPPFALSADGARSRLVNYVRYPRWASGLEADIFHVVDHGEAQLLSAVSSARAVVTCHDLFPFSVLRGVTRGRGVPTRREMLATCLRLLWLRRAAAVVAISNHTAWECRSYLHIPRERLHVVNMAIADPFLTMPRKGEPLAQCKDELTLLHVGSCSPRKGIVHALAVLARVKEMSERPAVLLKVGSKLDAASRVEAARLGVEGDVREVGWVDAESLVALYDQATALVAPSVHEGFCRPVAEALARGTPVVASNRGAIPELLDGLLPMFEPDEHEAMATQALHFAGNRSARERVATGGPARMKHLTVEAQARGVARVYEAVLSAV